MFIQTSECQYISSFIHIIILLSFEPWSTYKSGYALEEHGKRKKQTKMAPSIKWIKFDPSMDTSNDLSGEM